MFIYLSFYYGIVNFVLLLLFDFYFVEIMCNNRNNEIYKLQIIRNYMNNKRDVD